MSIGRIGAGSLPDAGPGGVAATGEAKGETREDAEAAGM